MGYYIFDVWRSRAAGRQMGHIGARPTAPKGGDGFIADYEMQLKQAAEQDINRIAESWENLDRRLKGTYCNAKATKDDASEALERATAARDTAAKRLNKAKAGIQANRPDTSLGMGAYLFLLTLLGLCELPFNATVFQPISDSLVGCYIMAAGLSVAFMFLSHLAGGAYRSRKWDMLVISAVITVAMVVGIAFIREKFIEVMNEEFGIASLFDPKQLTMVLIAINLGIFVAAFVASCAAHDPARNVQEAHKEFAEASREHRRASAEFNRAQTAKLRAEMVYNRAKERREKTANAYGTLVEGKRNAAQCLASIFRKAYVVAALRAGKEEQAKEAQQPADYPEIKPSKSVPEELDWGCPYELARSHGDDAKSRRNGEEA